MAAISTIVAVGALAIGGAAAYQGAQSRKEASRNYAAAAAQETKARQEQKALNAQQQADELRSQVREERVRRARILQAAENSGSGDSSGEYGALSSLSTQLNTNIGINLGRAQAGNAIGGYLQNAADFNTAAQRASLSAQNADSLMNLSMNIFSANGGFGAFKSAPAAKG